MRSRRFVLVLTTVALSGFLALGVAADQARTSTPASKGDAAFRTPWGEPDLQGIWNGETITPLERPARWADTPVLSPEEAEAVEQWVYSTPGRDDRSQRGTERDVAAAYNDHWNPPHARLSDRRTGLIIDPPDGRIPPMMPAAQERARAEREYLRALLDGTTSGRPGAALSPRRNEPPPSYNIERMNRSDGPEDRATMERCFGTVMPIYERVMYRIVQSPRQVGIYADFGQGQGFLRVIPVDGRPHPPAAVRLLQGDSSGRWEGDTLVVSVSNFTNKSDFRGSRENLRLVERFTRMSQDRLDYRVTVEDPTTWARPWTFEVPLQRQPEKANQIYESTCHEGNYGLLGMLASTRAAEARFAKGEGPDPATQDNASGGGTGDSRNVGNFPRGGLPRPGAR
ncbi:MAG: hypothetical protein EXQ48_07565 [Acidobacteria bacterium]|nr:hypothetical protein [Acidobacteriota bacterium]